MFKSFLAGALALTLTAPVAQAALITISGTPGTGISTISFSGTAQVRGSGTIRSAATGTNFDEDDGVQFRDAGGTGFLLDTSIQDDLFALTGNLMLTTNAGSASITDLFLDDDSSSDDFDDFGFRASSPYAYSLAADSVWTFSGSATLNVDFAAFNTGFYPIAGIDTPFSARDQIQMNVVAQVAAVPVPAALPILLTGLGALGLMARRRSRRA